MRIHPQASRVSWRLHKQAVLVARARGGRCAGIYEPSEECNIDDMDDPDTMMKNCVLNVCQPGNRLVSAGYVLYSSSTMLVVTIGEGVFGFTLDSQIGEFVLSHNNIKIPEEGKIYSFNEGNYQLWDESVQKYMDSLKEPEKWGGKPYSVRAAVCRRRPVSGCASADDVL